MKSFAIACLVVGLAAPAYAQYPPQQYGTGSNPNSNSVGGYNRNNGTYVQPYERTNPNGYKGDNYGAPGNVNPNRSTYGAPSRDFKSY